MVWEVYGGENQTIAAMQRHVAPSLFKMTSKIFLHTIHNPIRKNIESVMPL